MHEGSPNAVASCRGVHQQVVVRAVSVATRLAGMAIASLVAALALLAFGLTALPAGATSGSVGNLSVSVNPPSAGGPATYTINFTATDGISSSSPPDMTIVAPTGTNFCGARSDYTDNTNPGDSFDGTALGCSNPGNSVQLGNSLSASPGDSITLTISDVTNPSSTGAQSLSLYTNDDTTPVSASYQLTSGTVSNLSVAAYPSIPGASATYVINFTATGGLSSSSRPDMTIVAPNGTNFCGASSDYTDNTNPADSSNGTALGCSNPGNSVQIGNSLSATPGDSITLTISGVINPSVANGAYTLTLATNEDPTTVTSPGYPILPQGYWEVASDGGIFSFGTAGFAGSMGGKPLNAPIVGMTKDPATGGYWFVASDGGIFSFSAPFYGSMGGQPLDAPIVGMAATPDGGGYWLVASDGGIFSFGDAHFQGSMGGHPLNAPIVGMAEDPQTGGYWFVASDGGIFAFNAPFFGSMGGQPLNAPIVGMAAVPGQQGYNFVAADGGIFSFGAAGFAGSMGGQPLNAPIVGMAA